MIKKGYCCLLAAGLICLSSCKKKEPAKPKKAKQQTNMRSQVDIPLADEANQVKEDDSVRSFFDQDIGEFVALSQDENTINISENETASEMQNAYNSDDFAWVQEDTQKEQTEYKTVYFDYNSNKVRTDQQSAVATNSSETKKFLKEAKDESIAPTIVIEGHSCHSAGSAAYNLALSEKRAKSVADELIAAGVSQDRVKIIGRGQEVPAMVDGKVVSGSKEEQWANRRVEVHVIYS